LNAEHHAGPESCAKVRDACIAAEARAALFAHPKIGNAAIEVQANAGRVRLSSDALVPPWDELARQVVSKIEGVEAVELDLADPAMPPQRT
jgi:osmotically-inducible protein OsmY